MKESSHNIPQTVCAHFWETSRIGKSIEAKKKKKIVDLWSLGAEDLGEEMENDF